MIDPTKIGCMRAGTAAPDTHSRSAYAPSSQGFAPRLGLDFHENKNGTSLGSESTLWALLTAHQSQRLLRHLISGLNKCLV
jgi:hypothetical protein